MYKEFAKLLLLFTCVFLVTSLISFTSNAQDHGIAVNYPYDVGIENDPAVVFTENFEEATFADVLSRWNDTKNTAGMSFNADIPAQSAGRQSLMMTVVGGQNTGGHLYKRLAGHDILYARFYAKFPSDAWPLHHFVSIGGNNPPTNWPMGNAGVRPTGYDRFISGIETYGSAWKWDFYTYWMHMRTNPTGTYYGNEFHPNPLVPVNLDTWICVEQMIKVNDIGTFNGRQAFWIDDTKGFDIGQGYPSGYWVWDNFYPDPNDSRSAPFEGFEWRATADLDINFFWLSYFSMTGDNPPARSDFVLFDDIVLATEHVGCISTGPDIYPPVMRDGQPTDVLSEGTTQAEISLRTNENADCRFSSTAGSPYAAMPNIFSTSDSRLHHANVSGLENGSTYSFYVRCQDRAATPNPNTDDYVISFSVAYDSSRTGDDDDDDDDNGGNPYNPYNDDDSQFSSESQINVLGGCGNVNSNSNYSIHIVILLLIGFAVLFKRNRNV